MRRWWIGGVVLATFAMACQAAESPPDRPSVQNAADGFARALVAKDRTTLDSLITDDFLWIRGSGATGSKQEFIAALTDPSLSLDPIRPTDQTWIHGDDSSLLAAELTLTARLDGQPVTDHHRFADLWVWRDGAWRLAYIQATPIPAD